MINTIKESNYVLDIPNLVFRLFQGVDDYAHILDIIEGSKDEVPSFKARLGGKTGASTHLRVFSEGDVSTLEFSFSYRGAIYASFAVLAAMIGLSLVFWTPIPGVGSAIVLLFAFRANSAVVRFLNTVNEALPHIEREYARRALVEDRKRWESEPRDTEQLFTRLGEKHMKMWGNINVLWYKINEYQRQGLIYKEAVRKIAEEEGIDQG